MRVVGYYNSNVRQQVLENLDVKALTHINYAFLLPRSDGTVYFKNEKDVRRVVEFAHSKGLKAIVSIGGRFDENTVLDGVFKEIFQDSSALINFMQNILEVVKKYNFDGVDIDWEYPSWFLEIQLLIFLNVLKNDLGEQDKEISITIHHAIEGEEHFEYVEAISNTLVEAVDYLNIMTYNCYEMTNHSSLYLAKKCVNYWCTDRKIPKEKVLIGIPFYSKPSGKYYCEIVRESPISAYMNFYKKESYNGIELVTEKINFSKKNCGGVIIWAINYDTTDDYSLLTTIKKALRSE